MEEVLHTNIFFFITSIAVIIFTLLLCTLLYHLIKIVKSVRRVMDRIEAGSEIIADDMIHFRKYFSETSFLAQIVDIFFGRRGFGVKEQKATKKKPKRKSRRTQLDIKGED